MSTNDLLPVLVTDGQPEPQKLSVAASVQRMIFVASMYFKLIGVKDPTREELTAVNEQFKLVHNDRALKFPAAISNIIWGKVDLCEALKQYQANASMSALAMEILSQVPRWMKYGDGRAIRNDIEQVFECVRRY